MMRSITVGSVMNETIAWSDGSGDTRSAALVPNATVVRSSMPGEVGGGRSRTWSAPVVATTVVDLTWNAPLEAWSEAFKASSEALELWGGLSGSSCTPIEASTGPLEGLGECREASSKPDQASSDPPQASTRALEASSGAVRGFE